MGFSGIRRSIDGTSENQAPTEKVTETVAEFDRVPSTLSVQSHVSCGHVGNSAAVFPLQRAGFEVWPVHIVDFSNHAGYGQWRGSMIPAVDVREVIKSVDELGKLDSVDAIVFGYQGGSDTANVIIEAVTLTKQRNPKVIYPCDLVMGNVKGGCHVSDDIPSPLRDKVVPVADVITPSQLELGYLTGREVGDLESTLTAAHAAREMGPETILVTSTLRPERRVGEIEMPAVNDSGVWLVVAPYLPLKRDDSGDVTAVLLAGNLLCGRGIDDDLSVALGNIAASIFELLKVIHESGSGELELIRAQETHVHPEQRFEATKVA